MLINALCSRYMFLHAQHFYTPCYFPDSIHITEQQPHTCLWRLYFLFAFIEFVCISCCLCKLAHVAEGKIAVLIKNIQNYLWNKNNCSGKNVNRRQQGMKPAVSMIMVSVLLANSLPCCHVRIFGLIFALLTLQIWQWILIFMFVHPLV